MTQNFTTNPQNNNDLPGLDFSALILGLSSAALSYMGLASLPGQPPMPKNMALAKQNIDIIALLAEKTTGNLTSEESQLTKQVLSDLRLKFVEQSKS